MKNLIKTLFIVISVSMLCAALSICAGAEIYSGACGDTSNYRLDTETGILEITGTGSVVGSVNGSPWKNEISYIKTAIIADGITTIGERAFADCENLTSVSIPDSVTSIVSYAFAECTSLKSIFIPKNVYSVNDWALRGCSSLASINVDPFNENLCDIDGVLFSKNKKNSSSTPVAAKQNIPSPIV